MAIDHIVLAANTLEEGIGYLRARIGVDPLPGGAHPAMGTHNTVLRLGETIYLEVIAPNPDAPAPDRPRWMALDDPAMRAVLAKGPRLVCWMAATPDIDAMASRFGGLLGEVWHGERGSLRWRLTVRGDGTLPGAGAVPHLIQWPEGVHPTQAMPDLGFSFRSLTARHRAKDWLERTLDALGLQGDAETAAARGEQPLLELRIARNGREIVI